MRWISLPTIHVQANGTYRFRFVHRENRVPYYQRLFQKQDGKRMWWKVSSKNHEDPQVLTPPWQTERSGWLMWPYLISTYGLTAG